MLSRSHGNTIFILLTMSACDGYPQVIQQHVYPTGLPNTDSKNLYMMPSVPPSNSVKYSEDLEQIVHRKLDNEEIKKQLDNFLMIKQNTDSTTYNNAANYPNFKNVSGQYQIYTYDNINQISPRIQNDFNYFNGIAPRMMMSQSSNGNYPSYPNFHIAPKIQNGYNYMNVVPKFENVNMVPNVHNKMGPGQFSVRLSNSNKQSSDDEKSEKAEETKERTTLSNLDSILTDVLLRQNEIAEKLVNYLEDNFKQMKEMRSHNEFSDLMKDMKTTVSTTTSGQPTEPVYSTVTQLFDKTEIKEALKKDPLVNRILQLVKNKKQHLMQNS